MPVLIWDERDQKLFCQSYLEEEIPIVSLFLSPVNVVDYGGLLEAWDPEGRAGDEEGGVDLVGPLLHLLQPAHLIDLGDYVEELKGRGNVSWDSLT